MRDRASQNQVGNSRRTTDKLDFCLQVQMSSQITHSLPKIIFFHDDNSFSLFYFALAEFLCLVI